MDPRTDPRAAETRLPKIGSNGLWMGTPSMCAAPHPYYVDRNGKRSSPLQRASSEERLHQSMFISFLQLSDNHLPQPGIRVRRIVTVG